MIHWWAGPRICSSSRARPRLDVMRRIAHNTRTCAVARLRRVVNGPGTFDYQSRHGREYSRSGPLVVLITRGTRGGTLARCPGVGEWALPTIDRLAAPLWRVRPDRRAGLPAG